MTARRALKVFAWADNFLADATLIHHGGILHPENLHNWNPGRMTTITDGFITRQTPSALKNDLLVYRFPSLGTQHIATLSPLGRSGAELAATLDFLMTGTVPNVDVSYDTATNKFTFAATSPFDLMFNYSDVVRRFASSVGFDHVDLIGLNSYTSDYPVYCEDAHWLVYDIGLARSQRPMEAVMVYAPTISGSQDTIQLFGHGTDLGEDYKDWESLAAYKGTEQSAWNSGINDLHVWLPGVDKSRYWAVFVRRFGPATASSDTRIGVGGMWQDAWYDGDVSRRNHAAPWVVKPVVTDAMSSPVGGGALHLGRNRGHHDIMLPFRGWDRATAQELRRLYTRWGGQPHLWVFDPDAIDGVWDAAALASIVDFDGPKYSNVEEDADFTIKLRSVPMHPWE